MKYKLTPREKLILENVIEYYITQAEPIGSRTLSKKIKGVYSPATIRNIMADLEERELLQHLHISAGRIPTDKGYRYYVDNLCKKSPMKKSFKSGFESLSQIHERSELMEEISRQLSHISKYVGLILAPKITDLQMKHMDFIRLGPQKIMIVFISKTGWVYNKIIEIKNFFTQEKLNVINRYINEECAGLNLMEIRQKLFSQVSKIKDLNIHVFESLRILNDEIQKKHSEGLYLQGHINILKHPEFANMKKMRGLLKTLEEKIKLVELLDKCIYETGIKISIGKENEDPNIQDCSVVMTRYQVGKRINGALGIIGPTRMRYTEVINLVNNTATIVEKLFKEE